MTNRLINTQKELSEQAQALKGALNSNHTALRSLAQQLETKAIKRVFSVGSGDSWHLGHVASFAFWQYASVEFTALQSYEYLRYGHIALDDDTATIVISSSARGGASLDALKQALKTSTLTIGISDFQHSANPFLHDTHISLCPGAKKEGLPTQTTTATLLLLTVLALEWGMLKRHSTLPSRQHLLDSLVSFEKLTPSASRWAKKLAKHLASENHVYLLGSGVTFAVAQLASSLFAAIGYHAQALPLEEILHAWRLEHLKTTPILLLLPAMDEHLTKTLEILRPYNLIQLGSTVTKGHDFKIPLVPEGLSPLFYLLPLQHLALELGKLKDIP